MTSQRNIIIEAHLEPGRCHLTRLDDRLYVGFPLPSSLECTEGCGKRFVCKEWTSAKRSLERHLSIDHNLAIYRKFTSAAAAGWSSELAQLLMSTLVGRPMPFNLHPPLQLLRNTNAPNAGRGSPTGGVWLITRRHTSSRFERLPEPLLTHCHGQKLERRGRETGGWLDIRWAGSLRWILNSTRILIQG